jgi:hypothetical protein
MMLFLFVGVGVFFIVTSSMRMGSYKRLLQLTGQETGSEGTAPIQQDKPRQNHSLPVILTVVIVISLVVVLICGVGSYFCLTNAGALKNSESIPLSTFTAIEADCDVMALTILPGDSYTIRYSANEKLIPEFQVENGTLTLTQNALHTISFGSKKCSVTITVPYSTALDSADISTDVGDIVLRELQLASLSLTADVGDIDLAFCQFGDVTLTANVGDIDLDNSTFTSLSATADVGDVSVDLGEVSTDAASNLDTYTMQLSTDIGEVEVNNTDCRRNYVQTGTADHSVTIEVSTGNIKVNY